MRKPFVELRRYYGTVSCLTTCAALGALGSISTIGAALPVFQPPQLASDLTLVRSALEEAHPGLYRYTAKADLDREWQRAAQSLDRPMTALEFYRVVARVLALVKDGHLGWSLSDEVVQELDRIPVLPLGVRLIGNTPAIFRDLSSTEPEISGWEIVSVNGMTVSKLAEAMWVRQMGDGDVISSRRRGVGATFSRDLVRICDLRPPYRLTIRNPNSDKTETHDYQGVPLPEFMRVWRAKWPNDVEVRTERPLSELELLDDNRIARMRIPSFGSSEADARHRDLRSFFADAFKQMNDKHTGALIIDVRDNGGGEDEAGQILASYLIDKPFRYYRDLILKKTAFTFSRYVTSPDPIPTDRVNRGDDGQLHFTGHPNSGIKDPRQPIFSGKLFILMNGFSFSTTAEFLAVVRSKRPATFIGEESAGAFGGNNSGFEPTITLPNTKLMLRIPLMAYYVDVSDKYPVRRGILPDRPVEATIADLVSGRDKQLEFAISLARQSIP